MKSSSDELKRMRESEKARSKRRKKLNERIGVLEEEVEDLNSRMGSVFIQSDYQNLTELDLGLKAATKTLEETRAALSQEG